MASYSWLDSAIRGIAVPVVIAIAFRWFRRKFPFKQVSVKSEQLLEPVPAWYTPVSIVIWLVAIPVVTFSIAATVRSLNALITSAQGPVEFQLAPTPAWWYLYGGMGGLSFSLSLTALAMRWLAGRDRYASWTFSHNQQAGFDTDRVAHYFALVIMVPYTLAFLPSIGCHTRFSDDEIGIQTYADLKETRYSYHDVRSIAVVKGSLMRNGEFYKDPRIVIDFKDGRRWSSRDSFRDPEEINPDLAAFIALKTGMEYQYVDTAADLRR